MRMDAIRESGTAYLSGAPVFTPGFSGVCVTRSLVVECFVDRCFYFLFLSFGHCVVCLSSIYGFRLSLSASSNSYIWFIQYFIWTFHFKEYLVLTIICIFIHWAFRLQGNIQRINLIWANNCIYRFIERCKQLGIAKDQPPILNFGVGHTDILFPWCIII
jgi:hypothetical protein